MPDYNNGVAWIRDIAGNWVRVATLEEEEARPGGGAVLVDNQSDPPAEVSTIVAPGATIDGDEADFGNLALNQLAVVPSSPPTGALLKIEGAVGGTNDLLSIDSPDDEEVFQVATNGALEVSPDGLRAFRVTPTEVEIGHSARIYVDDDVIAFFGGSGADQSPAIADATDAASTMARLNDLLAYLRSLGLIAT